MYPGGLGEHRYPHFKKTKEFALGGRVTFNILAISGEWNAEEAIISA